MCLPAAFYDFLATTRRGSMHARRAQVSRRLARKLNAELRGSQLGYVHLIAATYAALVRGLAARDSGLLAKELILQPVVR